MESFEQLSLPQEPPEPEKPAGKLLGFIPSEISERTQCQYCEDVGPCRYCKRGRIEEEHLRKNPLPKLFGKRAVKRGGK